MGRKNRVTAKIVAVRGKTSSESMPETINVRKTSERVTFRLVASPWKIFMRKHNQGEHTILA